MSMTGIPLLGMLRERMSWLNARQNVLSQNVANADSPGYTARDLKPLDFAQMVKHASQPSSQSSVLACDDPRHIGITKPDSGFAEDTSATGDPSDGTSSNGTTVSLEEEMIKVADTQAQ